MPSHHTHRQHSLATRMPVLALAFFAFLAVFPFYRAEAAQVSASVDRRTSLEAAVLEATENGEKWPLDEIETLVVSGEGTLTEEDGAFIREQLPNVTELNLGGFRGGFEDGAFRGCSTIRRVKLCEGARLSRELFYGCSALEEVDWPVRISLKNDCFAYCALDFSDGYPSLINEENVITFASNQRPRVYFTMPGGSSGTITAGGTFRAPYSLRTLNGNGYLALVSGSPSWLLTRPEEVEVTQRITRDGEFVEQLDTLSDGTYEITYSLPYTTFCDQRSQTYTLTVLPGSGGLAPLVEDAAARTAKGYTEESWNTLQSALQNARQAIQQNAGAMAEQRARDTLNRAIQGLEVEIHGLPEEVRVGESFILSAGTSDDPEGWQWDEEVLNATFGDKGAQFIPLMEGEAEIAYVDTNGDTGKVTLNIKPGDASGGAGSRRAGPVLAISIVLVLAAGAVALVLWRRRQNAKS